MIENSVQGTIKRKNEVWLKIRADIRRISRKKFSLENLQNPTFLEFSLMIFREHNNNPLNRNNRLMGWTVGALTYRTDYF